jgi:lysyl-tRNA synthetase, class II
MSEQPQSPPPPPTPSQLEADRRAKLAKIKELGIDPFGQRIDGLTSIGAARELPKSDAVPEADAAKVKVAGRLIFIRDMGKLWFVRLRDESGEIQVALDAKRLSERDVALRKLLDLGDLIAVEGSLGTTKTGETTIWAGELQIACKTLNPPPAKWEGLTDVEARYRQRYADLAYNPDVMRTMKLRIRIVDAMRTFMKGKGFEEVETPMLQPIHGGAAARPFETHHRALDMKLFLRIAPELYLKRLLVGGFTKVFEINRNFRNEGISPKHNPEFTMLEAYWAFASWEKMADLVEEMITTIARDVLGTLTITRAGTVEAPTPVQESTGDHVKHASLPNIPPVVPTDPDNAPQPPAKTTINLARPWRRVPMADLVHEATGWTFDKQSIAGQPHAITRAVAAYEPDGVNALSRRAAGLQLTQDEERAAHRATAFEKHLLSLSPAEQLTELFEKLVEPNLIDPCFVTRVPGVIVPLARRCKDDDYFADVYELAINGQEISPGYTELNDPDVQAEHFRHQVGDREEQQKVDEDFLTALKYGMPPAGGIGLGIDRFVAMLTGQASLRDVILFPLMRSQG